MTANGQFRVVLEDGDDANLYADSGKLAIDVADALHDAGLSATVWEKNRSGWQQIYMGQARNAP